MDPFLIGWKGVAMTEPMPAQQVELLQWAVEQIGRVLAEPKAQGWNKRWLDVLRLSDVIARRGIKVPAYGFGDPQTYDFLAKIIHKVEASGAVRHGAEAFNYHFPQVRARRPATPRHTARAFLHSSLRAHIQSLLPWQRPSQAYA